MPTAPSNQPDLFAEQVNCDLDHLRARLQQTGWQTRSQLSEHFGWSERYIRDLAEALGPEIVRGQAGFKLTSQLTRDELPLGQQASDAFISQGKKMLRYGLALRRKLHEKLG